MGNCCDAADAGASAEITTEPAEIPDFTITTGEGGFLVNQKWLVKANQTVQ